MFGVEGEEGGSERNVIAGLLLFEALSLIAEYRKAGTGDYRLQRIDHVWKSTRRDVNLSQRPL